MYKSGRNAEVDRLTELVYHELKHTAGQLLRRERLDYTFQPTVLVHEAYLKMSQQESAVWGDKSNFLAVASMCMRRILMDHARRRHRIKRGGKKLKISLDDLTLFSPERSEDLISLDEALAKLSDLSKRQAAIVECRFYGGLSVEETAEILNISPKTAKNDWRVAKAWLYGELKSG